MTRLSILCSGTRTAMTPVSTWCLESTVAMTQVSTWCPAGRGQWPGCLPGVLLARGQDPIVYLVAPSGVHDPSVCLMSHRRQPCRGIYLVSRRRWPWPRSPPFWRAQSRWSWSCCQARDWKKIKNCLWLLVINCRCKDNFFLIIIHTEVPYIEYSTVSDGKSHMASSRRGMPDSSQRGTFR
jgi:hypothetical protein